MAAPVGNKFAVGNNGGRPPLYGNVEDLKIKCNEYFQQCADNFEKATVTGLALYLGFCTRASLDDYAEKSEEYLYVIKRAKLTVENSYEKSGQMFDIFALKNMGWKDKQEVENSGNMNFTWNEQKTYDSQQKTDDSA